MEICYVYLNKIRSNKKDFATLVPKRTAELLKKDFQVSVLYRGTINEESLKQKGVKVYKYGKGGEWEWFVLPIILNYKLFRLYRRKNVDIFSNVWSHYLIFPLMAVLKFTEAKLIARVAGIPIRSRMTNISPLKKLKRSAGLILERLSFNFADQITTLSKSLKSEMLKRGAHEDDLTVISQGVNLTRFRDVGSRSTLEGLPLQRSQLSRYKVLFVGRLSKRKKIGDLIRAFNILEKQLKDTTSLLIAGDGPEKRDLIDLASDLDQTKNIFFLGYINQENLPDIYKLADLFVLPSSSEGLPNVIMEAQASGLPVLGSNVGGVPELLNDGRGMLFSPGDIDELSEKMKKILQNENLRSQMSRKSENYIEKEHSFDALKSKYEKLFRKMGFTVSSF